MCDALAGFVLPVQCKCDVEDDYSLNGESYLGFTLSSVFPSGAPNSFHAAFAASWSSVSQSSLRYTISAIFDWMMSCAHLLHGNLVV